ncbi:MAG: hypothetical protein J6332_00955, partial [Abditibacteriota bacterium]|nr:hypothetical protein [Abditibacteriota bacterium]
SGSVNVNITSGSVANADFSGRYNPVTYSLLGKFIAVTGASSCVTNSEGKVHPCIKATDINILER